MAETTGPAFELQTAIVAALKDNADLKALCGNQATWLHQDVPMAARKPYATIGEGQALPDLADCIDGSEIFTDLHVWADKIETARKIMATIWTVLSAATLNLSENDLKLLERAGDRVLRDPDGVTKHGVLTLRALMEPN